MKSRFLRFGLFIAIIPALFIISFGCGGKKGGIEPPSELDKIIFEKTLTVEESGNTWLSPYYPDVQYDVASLIKSGLNPIMPPLNAEFLKPLGLAKNGDMWAYNTLGLFKSNVKRTEARTQLMLPSQKMATDFIGDMAATEGVYRVSGKPALTFVKYPGDPENYMAFISYSVMIDTATEYGFKNVNVIIQYDSKDDSFTPLFPFVTGASSGNQSISIGMMIDEQVFKDNGLYYQLEIKKDQDITYFLLRYDPFENKHYLELAGVPLFPGMSDIIKAEGKVIWVQNPLTAEKIQISNCVIAKDGKSDEEAKALAAKCVNGEVAKRSLNVYESSRLNTDVTANMANLDAVYGLVDKVTTPSVLGTIPASAFTQFSPDSPLFTCNQTSCFLWTSYGIDPANEIALIFNNMVLYTNYIPYLFRFGTNKIYFSGMASEDGNAYTALNKFDLKSGSLEVIQKEDATKIIYLIDIAKGTSGLDDVLAFEVTSEVGPGNFINSLHFYNSKDNKAYQAVDGINKLISGNNFSPAEAYEDKTGHFNFIIHDGNKAFLNIKDKDATDSYYYYLDLPAFFSAKNADASAAPEFQPAAPGAANVFLMFYWKGVAFWGLYTSQTENKIYVNQPFEKENEIAIFSDNWAGFVTAKTITSSVPPELPGFDLSANLAESLKCGGGTEQSLWCPSPQMCKDGICKDMSVVECNQHKDCSGDYICSAYKCIKRQCSMPCPVGTKCNDATSYCTALENANECVADNQCVAANNVCILDTALGYKTCQVEEGKCTVDDDCNEGFICASSKDCLPRMSNVIMDASPTGPGYSSTTLSYWQKITWPKVKDNEGNDINDYVIQIEYLDDNTKEEESATGTSKSVWLKIPGDKKERYANIYAWPRILGITQQDIDKMKWTSPDPIKLTNTTHCMLTDPGTDKCPSASTHYISPITMMYTFECVQNECIKKLLSPVIPMQPAPITIFTPPLIPLLPLSPEP